MHQAEYLAQTVANLLKQRAELQRLKQAVEVAERHPLRDSAKKAQVTPNRSSARMGDRFA